MQITKEYIQTRIGDLQRQKDQHLADANACEGGLQIYKQLLDYLSSEETQPHEGN